MISAAKETLPPHLSENNGKFPNLPPSIVACGMSQTIWAVSFCNAAEARGL